MILYLSAGHTPEATKGTKADPGAIGNGLHEANLTSELRNLVLGELMLIAPTLKVLTDKDNQQTGEWVSYLVKNAKQGDVICDIHFNAATPAASGTEVIIPKAFTAKEKELGTLLNNAIIKVLNSKDRGVKTEAHTARGKIGILFQPGIATNVLIEVCFISNKGEIENYQKHKISVAKAIAKVLADWCI
jgi:N-acetylmuramoyl-L-alanine amidase